ncbi:MAG: 50S ribosomal protein L22 [Anaerolineaceae bacterium 4572_78]|nr:MAG: 50S ribosomal protein L22 [Anaerolineaceae bacterium 4572_78]
MSDIRVRAVAKYVRGSPLKARRVINVIRGMPVLKAIEVLNVMPHAAAHVVAKTVRSAMHNAEENYELDPEDLVIVGVSANEGPRWRRIRFGARGRVKPICKRTSHITVVLEPQVEEY